MRLTWFINKVVSQRYVITLQPYIVNITTCFISSSTEEYGVTTYFHRSNEYIKEQDARRHKDFSKKGLKTASFRNNVYMLRDIGLYLAIVVQSIALGIPTSPMTYNPCLVCTRGSILIKPTVN